jgi:hypothetical protein
LSAATIVQRAKWEMSDLGWGQSLFLALGVVAAGYLLLRYRRRLHLDDLWLLGLWAVLTYLALSTSANHGTAFGLPIIAIMIVACATVIGQAPRPWRVGAVLVAAPVLAIGWMVTTTSSDSHWWPGPAYRLEVLQAGGTARTNSDLLNQQVAAAVGRSPVLLTRVDDLLNGNGLRWELGSSSDAARLNRQLIAPTSWTSVGATIHALDKATVWISGESVAPYVPILDPLEIEAAAARMGFYPVRAWTISPYNNVVLWRRGERPSAANRFVYPVTFVVRPIHRSVVTGRILLDAGAQSIIGISSVTYVISSPELSHTVRIPSRPTHYGWLTYWNTAAAPDGTYSITSVATSPVGASTRSAAVDVVVKHATAGG